jgi:type IV fimbrial biogenesis protein FimT
MADMGRKQQGLTLIELMVTLAVAIILITVGMPMFTGIAANNRAAAQTNDLVSALKLARSEAVKRSDPVVARQAGTTWSEGWLVFVDDNDNGVDDPTDNNGVYDNGAGETLLRSWDAPVGGSVTTGGTDFVSFAATGENSGAQVDFELDQPDATGSSRRCVSVTATGQVRMKKEQAAVAWSCP